MNTTAATEAPRQPHGARSLSPARRIPAGISPAQTPGSWPADRPPVARRSPRDSDDRPFLMVDATADEFQAERWAETQIADAATELAKSKESDQWPPSTPAHPKTRATCTSRNPVLGCASSKPGDAGDHGSAGRMAIAACKPLGLSQDAYAGGIGTSQVSCIELSTGGHRDPVISAHAGVGTGRHHGGT